MGTNNKDISVVSRRSSPEAYIWQLILSFPCLRGKFHGQRACAGRFDPDWLYEASGPWSHGERACVLFALNVWNPGDARAKGWAFDIFDFAGIADSENKEVVLQWVLSPVWP
jgi:hypothetical protein